MILKKLILAVCALLWLPLFGAPRVLNSEEATKATVRVLITSSDGFRNWTTVGVSTNVIDASWHALLDGTEYYLSDKRK